MLSTRSIYKNPWIKVREDKIIRQNGREGIFGVVDYGSGVSIVALDANKQIYLVKEYYYAIERYGLQVPSGGIDKKETPLKAAKKELLEETGLKANRWVELGFVNPLTMILKSPAYLFLAFDLVREQKGEADIVVVTMPFQSAYQMVLDSKITHAPSCVAILKAKIYLDSSGKLNSV